MHGPLLLEQPVHQREGHVRMYAIEDAYRYAYPQSENREVVGLDPRKLFGVNFPETQMKVFVS